jgi:D-amino-acid dehydrogenase
MLLNCTPEAYAANKARMVRLAEYSRDCLEGLREETGIRYDERTKGTLQVFRKEAQVEAAGKDIAVLREGGVAFEVLDRDGVPCGGAGLRGAAGEIVGGLRLPGDETGDCFLFTTRLAELAAEAGVRFRWNTGVERLLVEGGRVRGAVTSEGELRADAVVVALGSHSPALVRPLGMNLPVYPVKGYSLTLPIGTRPWRRCPR